MSKAAPKQRLIEYIDMGPIPAWVFVCTDEMTFYRSCEKWGVQPDGPFIQATASTHKLGRPSNGGMETLVLCFNRPKKLTHAFAGLVAHEASHCVEWCFEAMGEEKPGDEARAYMVQFLVQKCLDNIFGAK